MFILILFENLLLVFFLFLSNQASPKRKGRPPKKASPKVMPARATRASRRNIEETQHEEEAQVENEDEPQAENEDEDLNRDDGKTDEGSDGEEIPQHTDASTDKHKNDDTNDEKRFDMNFVCLIYLDLIVSFLRYLYFQ